MLYAAIFLTIFVAGWLICAFLPWLVLSVVTRGNAGLVYLPLSLFTGVVAGLAVPLIGLNDMTGLILSFVAAMAVPSLLLVVAHFSRGAVAEQRRAARNAREGTQPP
ncbi:MAG: hypothetical protein ABI305_05290 [Tepidiformaceae bacterium]